jgi:hypothetical protein
MRRWTPLIGTGAAITAFGVLLTAYYLLFVVPSGSGTCIGCPPTVFGYPLLFWGLGTVTFGLIVVLVGFLIRGIIRTEARERSRG